MTKTRSQQNCFVISPIGEAKSDIRKYADKVLDYIIKRSLEPLGYEIVRADKISEPGTINLQILKRIVESEIVIADLTGTNPNVMYELAIRHAIKKPVIILIKSGEKIPFDVATERAIFYDLDSIESIKNARKGLVEQAKFIQNNEFKIDTPFSVIEGLLSTSKSFPSTQSKASKAKNFGLWDGLSDTVVIIYGAKYNQDRDKNGHLSLSLRDLNAAQAIHAFFARKYPKEDYPTKSFILIPALANGWQALLRENTDLILVGGFVVNDEFAQHRTLYQQRLRLKMGRLCYTDERHVYHIESRGESLREQPHKIEELSSEFITQDFALVSRTRRNIYGSTRNVITIAGIKGHGTLEAAKYLTDSDNVELNNLNIGSISDLNTEIIIKTNVTGNMGSTTELVKIILGGKSIKTLYKGKPPWEVCKLDPDTNPCRTCTFGEILPKYQIDPSIITNRLELKGIIFDLDDTLIDTFSMLISPLEEKAVKKISLMDSSLLSLKKKLTDILLELRAKDPVNIETILREQFSIKPEILVTRQSIIGNLGNIKLDKLAINPEVRSLLRELKNKYKLFLLTEGNEDFQNRKINHLRIRDLFTEIKISSTAEDSKEKSIETLMKKYEKDNLKSSSLIIIGNRLDKEILAGNRLGIRTVWVRHGEGSNPSSDNQNGVPDYIIDNILDIKEVLAAIVKL